MKKLFSKGLGALLPMVLTIFLLYFVGKTIYETLGVPLGDVLKWAATTLTGQTEEALRTSHPSWDRFFKLAPAVGFIIGIFIVFMVGALVATFFGKKIYKLLERKISRLPVIKVIYPYARQFTDFLFSSGEHKMEFKNAVAVPFPYSGVYSIAFVSSEGMRLLNDVTGKKMVCVFVPHSPTPFTGVVCYVPREEIIPLPITVDEAMRIVISCGVISPSHQLPTGELPPMPGPKAGGTGT